MTIAIAWIRKLRDCEELIFVSDSRLSGDGRNFDACPKILTLPRDDCAICFAGYTGHAYPLMLQLALAIDSYAPARRGSLDLGALKTHALRLFDGVALTIATSSHVSPQQDEAPEATFLFGGYSWIKKRFELWSVSFSAREDKFVAQPAQWLSYLDHSGDVALRRRMNAPGSRAIGQIALAGDQAPAALARLNVRLKTPRTRSNKLDMEPFEVVRDMLRDRNRSETIGGPPQIVKVYQYMRSAALGVYWPRKRGGSVFVQGRQRIGYEQVDRWILDPDTLVSEHEAYTVNDASEE
jgi:hypothetical protein